MQKKRTFSGTIANIGSARSRASMIDHIYTTSQYDTKVDLVNQSIADFLHNDCGVDARYGTGEGSTDKFLWIFGAPFFFLDTATTGTSLTYWEARAYNNSTQNRELILSAKAKSRLAFFANPTSGAYKFALYYIGNSTEGCLRIQHYNSNYPNFSLIIAKTKNILLNQDSMIYSVYQTIDTATTTTRELIPNIGAVTFNADGSIDKSHTNNYTLTSYYQLLGTPDFTNYNQPLSGGKFPLIPIIFGVHKPTHMYCLPCGFGLPASATVSTETIPEVTIQGRTFAVTAPPGGGGAASSYINCGLLECV